MRALPRAKASLFAAWLIPAVAALSWAGVLMLATDAPLATSRSLVFLGGPLVLLAGLHGRLFGFLHAPDRARWLPLPIAVSRHWQAGARTQISAFGVAALLGVAAVVAGSDGNIGLALEFGYFVVIAGLLEPVASAVASALGRRFPTDSRPHELQRSLGGGWTTPEAVVHLYAPAFVLALAVLLAMPGQLSLERWLDGHALAPGHMLAIAIPPVLAIGLRVWAPRPFEVGFWEAVPWLAEATRTLAGPPQPEATPAWAKQIPNPWTRLVVTQFWRLTPLPYLRLMLIAGVAVHVLVRSTPVSGPVVAAALAVAGLWILPGGAVLRETRARARLSGALPLPARARSGLPSVRAATLLAAPVLCLAGAITVGLLR